MCSGCGFSPCVVTVPEDLRCENCGDHPCRCVYCERCGYYGKCTCTDLAAYHLECGDESRSGSCISCGGPSAQEVCDGCYDAAAENPANEFCPFHGWGTCKGTPTCNAALAKNVVMNLTDDDIPF